MKVAESQRYQLKICFGLSFMDLRVLAIIESLPNMIYEHERVRAAVGRVRSREKQSSRREAVRGEKGGGPHGADESASVAHEQLMKRLSVEAVSRGER